MSHQPLSYLSKQEISSPQLLQDFFFSGGAQRNVLIVLKNQSVSCSHHVTFILPFSSSFWVYVSSYSDYRSSWKRVPASSHEKLQGPLA